MKITTKILNLLWASFWSYMLLWMFLVGHSLDSLLHRPVEAMVTAAALVWSLFAIALFFERRWAWYVSSVFTVLSLLATLYIFFDSVFIAPSSVRGGFILEGFGALLLPILVLAALVYTRRQFLRPHEKAA